MIRRLLSSIGYLLYTLVILVCLLWWKFPADTVKTWLEQQLDARSSGYVWKIESLQPALPGRLRLTGISMTPVKQKMPLVTMEQLDLIPDPARLFNKSKLVRYKLRLFGGIASGRVVSSTGFQQFDCRGRFDNLRIGQMKSLRRRLQRKVNGIAAGDFFWRERGPETGKTEIQGKLTLTGGTLPLRKPVLGLSLLPYSKIETGFKYQAGNWIFEKGKLVSPKMSATFSGRIEPAGTIADSALKFNGSLIPRSELFTKGDSQLAGMIRSFLKDGGLPFTLIGTAAEPGIHFADGLSRAMNRLQGSRR